MTAQEAIELINGLKTASSKQECEAINMAISALEKQANNMTADEKIVSWMQDGVNIAKETACSSDFMAWMIKSSIEISNGQIAEQEARESEDKLAVIALMSVLNINKYLESECEYSNSTVWVDKNGYYFRTDMGYFWDGLDDFENCLIKRLRKAETDRKWDH